MPESTPTAAPPAGAASSHEVENFLRRHLVALVVQDGDYAGRDVLVTRLPFLVGRGRAATMTIAHETVSRRHAWIRLGAGGALELVDNGSANGSRVNGKLVEVAPLADGDELRFGSMRYQLLIEDRGPIMLAD